MLFAGSMMATNLFDPATTTLDCWAMPGWGTENTTFGSYDATTGAVTLTVPGDCNAQWQCQVKLNTTGITLDPTKNYEFKCKINSSAAVSNVTIKIFDNLELSLITNLALVAGDNDYATDAFAGSDAAHNGVIVFDFGFAAGNTAITISDIELVESTDTSISLADTYSKANGDTVILKDFEVVYVNGAYMYVKDATASGLLYLKNYGLVAGDKEAKGLEAKISIYNNLYEIIPITAYADLAVTAGTPAQPVQATAAPTTADNKYLVYKDVTFLADSLGTATTASKTIKGVMGNDTITFYNTFRIAAVEFEAGKTYDVVGFNTCYKTTIQVAVVSIEEHESVTVDCGDHGLYDAANATINSTYFAANGWTANPGCSATIENGNIIMHVDQAFVDMWQGQVFVNPGVNFEDGKMYHYEFDVVSSGKVCIYVKVNDDDANAFYAMQFNDINIGGGTWHFSTDSVIANANLSTAKGPLVFGFGWTDANQDVIIKCIKITEVGDAPEPVEPHMYIKHPWGTGLDADWTWQEMTATTYNTMDAWTYTGAWGGAGFNVADNAEGENASWYAAATDIQFLDAVERIIVDAPAVGTEDCEFIYVPGSSINKAVVIVPAAQTAVDNVEAVKVIKTIENGQLVIIKNGVRYNAQGTAL